MDRFDHRPPAARPSPGQARRALDAIAGVTVVSRRDIRVLQTVLAGIGLAMAGVLLLVRAAEGNPAGIIAGMLVYSAVILMLVLYNVTARAAPRGYSRRYGWGCGGTMALYTISVVLISTGTVRDWALTGALAALTALPAIVAACGLARLAQP